MRAVWLRTGEPVRLLDGRTAEVVALRDVAGAGEMWDLTVSQMHTFAVGDAQAVVQNTAGPCGNDSIIGQRMQRRVNDDLLDPPLERGDPPTEKATGKSIEIHYINQDPTGPYEEMTPYEHRGRGNYRANHPFLGRDYPSRIDRDLFEQQKEDYWTGEWERGRWGPK